MTKEEAEQRIGKCRPFMEGIYGVIRTIAARAEFADATIDQFLEDIDDPGPRGDLITTTRLLDFLTTKSTKPGQAVNLRPRRRIELPPPSAPQP